MYKNNYFILTVKDYLAKEQQLHIESEITKYIFNVWRSFHLRCVFIPTGANPIEENDLPVGERMSNKINNKSIFAVKIPKNPEATKKIIRKAKFAICTRMHSAIFAITEFTPFIAIAYEHKSIGLLRSLQLSEWSIKMREVTAEALTKKTSKLLEKSNYQQFINHLNKKRPSILAYRDVLKNHLINI